MTNPEIIEKCIRLRQELMTLNQSKSWDKIDPDTYMVKYQNLQTQLKSLQLILNRINK